MHSLPLSFDKGCNKLNINREVTLYRKSYRRCMTDTFLLDHFLELVKFFPVAIYPNIKSSNVTLLHICICNFQQSLVNNLFLDIVIWPTYKWICLICIASMEKHAEFVGWYSKHGNFLNNCNNFFQNRNPPQVLWWQYLEFFSTITISLLYFNHKAIILTKLQRWQNMKPINLVSIWAVCHISGNFNHTLFNYTVFSYNCKLLCRTPMIRFLWLSVFPC